MTSLSLPDALRACIEAQAADHQFAAFGSALFIRQHGPALEALLRGEWTDEQCVQFMCVALRHAEYSNDGPSVEEIRQGVMHVMRGPKP